MKVRPLALDESRFDSIDSVTAFVKSKRVWATTCLGVSHVLFGSCVKEQRFDFVIVDEASQLSLPACLGPLYYGAVFVLVGDHYQLPPLVVSQEARDKGLDVSLFKLLSEAHPNAVCSLEYQYRMNEDIMTLSNLTVYGGRLKCGTEAQRLQSLELPAPYMRPNLIHSASKDWIVYLLEPQYD